MKASFILDSKEDSSYVAVGGGGSHNIVRSCLVKESLRLSTTYTVASFSANKTFDRTVILNSYEFTTHARPNPMEMTQCVCYVGSS